MPMGRVVAMSAVVALAMSPVATAHASATTIAHKGGEKPKDSASVQFYAHDSLGHLAQVSVAGAKTKAKALTTVISPVWWRTFYLTPTAAAGSWVVGVFSGDQKDVVDPPRLFAFDPATKAFHWLTRPSSRYRSPVVDTERKPKVFYVAGTTVREATTSGASDHSVFSAPSGWTISALSVGSAGAPYIALTHNSGTTPATATSYVVHLATTPSRVIAASPGSVTALALSPDAKTLALSRVMPSGDSVLTLSPQARGGLQKTLPNVGKTSQVSWSGDGHTLAVDPQEWGGWMLVNIATRATSYPSALQPYAGGIFVPTAATND
jgi:hypothetical protein